MVRIIGFHQEIGPGAVEQNLRKPFFQPGLADQIGIVHSSPVALPAVEDFIRGAARHTVQAARFE